MAKLLVAGKKNVLRWVALTLLAVIAWRVLSLGMADANTRSSPERALAWRENQSSALFMLAEKQAGDPARWGDAKKNAIAALRAYPLEGRAYRVLGKLAESEKNTGQALAMFEKAVRYSPRDIESHLWLLNHSLRIGDANAAVLHLDRLLRMQIDSLPQLMPVIGGLAMQPASQSALMASMMKNPPWRSPAIKTLMAQPNATQNYGVFFSRMAKTQTGLTEDEEHAWVAALNQNRQWPLAYLNWASQLPPASQLELGNIFNGNFEHEPLGSDFDWRFEPIAGASIGLAVREGMTGKSALQVSFEGRRVPFNNVRQTLVLPAGRYRFSGQGLVDGLRTELGLVWSIECLGGAAKLAKGTPWKGTSSEWQRFSLDFEVPPDQCPAQSLSLKLPARVESEQLIAGTVWFDGFRIQKIQGFTEQKPNF